jgi:ADP-ribosyl-[dinitrogen reductase] hydrolase
MSNLPVVLTTLNRPDYFSEWSLQQSHIRHNSPLSLATTLTLGRTATHLINTKVVDACKQEAE